MEDMSEPSPTPAEPILVALGSEARTLRLVHTGFRMAREQGRPWVAVHVAVLDWETPEEADQARVWLDEARALGAETAWVRAGTVSDGLIAEGGRRGATQVVLGRNRPEGPWARLEHARSLEAIRRSLGARIVLLPLDQAPARGQAARTPMDFLALFLVMATILAMCSIFAAALFEVIGFPGLPPVYALGVGFVAHRWGRAFSVPVSVAAVLLFDLLFVPNRWPSRPEDWSNGLYFAAALILVQMLVLLVARLHRETRSLHRREAESILLMLLGRALARCATTQEVASVLAERLHGLFRAQAWLLVPGEGDAWRPYPDQPEAPSCPRPSEFLPHFSNPLTRMDPFEPLFLNGCSFVAMAGQGGAEGLLQLKLEGGGPFPPESWGLFQSLAVQGALALERVRWLEEAHQARLDNETERMRNTLLGAISHDLRTPLAAIQGAATSLLLPEPLPEAARLDLLAMIRDESHRLARLLSDLLELTRLQGGGIQIRKEWQLLDEVVGSAVLHLEKGKGQLPIRMDLPASLPLVPLDGALMEQVLINLLGNALRHAPGSAVELRAWETPDCLQLEIADRGPGIPAEFRKAVFEKFFRMPRDLKDGGVGLGLAIAATIVKLHDGAIWVEARDGGGALLRVTLPLGGLPPAHLESDPPPLTLEMSP